MGIYATCALKGRWWLQTVGHTAGLNEVPFSQTRISKSLRGRRLGPASGLPAVQREAMNARRVQTLLPWVDVTNEGYYVNSGTTKRL